MIATSVFGNIRLRAEWGGYCPFIRQKTNALHQHEFGEICLVTAGSGRYRHGSQSFPVGKGDLFAAFPGVLHEISSYETGDLELYFVRFGITRLDGMGQDPGRISVEEKIVRKFSDRTLRSPGGGGLVGFIPLIEAASTANSPITMKAAESALIHLTLAMMEKLGNLPGEVTDAAAPTLWERAQAVIEAHIDTGIDAETLARELGVCSRTLRRAAIRETGTGLAQQINQTRMRYAAHRLLMGFSVAEVATQFHFSEPAVFTRCFRRVVGTAPSNFKRNYQLGNRVGKPESNPARKSLIGD